MTHPQKRVWTRATTWTSIAVAAIATVLLFLLAYTGPSLPITEVDFSGSRVFVVRLVGGVFMLALTSSCILQAALFLPQRAALRAGVTAPTVIDLGVIVGVIVETGSVLAVGFRDDPGLNLTIVGIAAVIALLALIRFILISWSGVQELAARRRARRSA